MSQKIINLDYGFKAYECSEFYEKLNGFLNYKPSSLGKNKIKKELKKTIKFVVIDAPLWNKMIAFWKKRLINLSYGFYDIEQDTIFININTCGVNATKECKINGNTSSNILRRLSEIIAHEFIHYKFQRDTFKVLNKTKNDLLKFYKTFWKDIVIDDILPYIYRAHYYVAINTNKNIIDPLYGRITKIQLNRFIKILDNIQENHKSKILKPQTFSDTIEVIRSIKNGSIIASDFVEAKILISYKRTFSSTPPITIKVGQELVYASEVLSICANMTSSKSYEIVRKIITS